MRMGIGQPYTRVDLIPMLVSTFIPRSGTFNLASVYSQPVDHVTAMYSHPVDHVKAVDSHPVDHVAAVLSHPVDHVTAAL